MGVYLRAKFEVSSIILTGFRQGGVILHPPPPPPFFFFPNSKRIPEKPAHARVKTIIFYQVITRRNTNTEIVNSYTFLNFCLQFDVNALSLT